MTPRVSALEVLARQAGDAILGYYRGAAEVGTRKKADASPVTEADLAAHRVIVPALMKMLPGVPVISEESVDDVDAVGIVRDAARYWLVDPLDGTRDFLSKSDDFTVNIALVESGKVVLSCVFAPARGRMFLAERGKGATGDGKALHVARADVSMLRFLVSRHHAGGEAARIAAVFPGAMFFPTGSALKYCLIAEGTADVALRRTPTSLWDTAAAQLVLEEAGGLFLDRNAAPFSYRARALENPAFIAIGDRSLDHAALRAILL